MSQHVCLSVGTLMAEGEWHKAFSLGLVPPHTPTLRVPG